MQDMAVVFSSAGEEPAPRWARGRGIRRMPIGELLRERTLPPITVIGLNPRFVGRRRTSARTTSRDQLRDLTGILASMQNVSPNSYLVFLLSDVPEEQSRSDLFEQFLEPFAEPQRVEITALTHRVKELLESLKAKVKLSTQRNLPRPSPLDGLLAVTESTADLRADSGKLSAKAIARVFGLSIKELAEILGKTRQAVTKTPDAESLQAPLEYFERVARARGIYRNGGQFRRWLRIRNPQLNNESPLSWIRAGRWQALADLVDDMLTGAPS